MGLAVFDRVNDKVVDRVSMVMTRKASMRVGPSTLDPNNLIEINETLPYNDSCFSKYWIIVSKLTSMQLKLY